MYQGKFDSKNKGGNSDIYAIIAQRSSTPAPRPAAEQDIIGKRPQPKRDAVPAQTQRSNRNPVPAAEAPVRAA